MLVQLFIMFNVLAFGTLFLAFFLGMFRDKLEHGKAVACILILISMIVFSIIAFESFNIEVTDCNQINILNNGTTTITPSCATDVKVYLNLSILYGGFAVLSGIMFVVYALLMFGDINSD